MAEDAPLVTVFASGDSAEIIVAKLLLEASEVLADMQDEGVAR